MSILRAMYTGVSGLRAEGEALGVVGDNVANSNTVGFKRSRAVFEDMVGGMAGKSVIGAGVHMARTQQIFAQGAMLTTGQSTDLALTGDGFFVVNGTVDGNKGNFYSRSGQTTLRNDGTLVNPAGLSLQGYARRPDGTFSSQLSDIQLSSAALSPKTTTSFSMDANLDASAVPPTVPFDPQNPAATSNFSTGLQMYDSLGVAHDVEVYFRQTSPGNWTYDVLARGSEVVGGVPGQNQLIGNGTLNFNAAGALQSVTGVPTVSFVNANGPQTLTLDFGTPIATGGTGLDGITQFSAPSTVTAQKQDGYGAGQLSGVTVSSDGTVSGVYTNGQTIAVAQVAVAKFQSTDGLGRAGQNLFKATIESGEPAFGTAGVGGRAAMVSGALEQSNVDIAAQFVDLIAHQRAFQANSKTITTADQMLQELMMIKQ
jgi:flagellar hook protein FlgE